MDKQDKGIEPPHCSRACAEETPRAPAKDKRFDQEPRPSGNGAHRMRGVVRFVGRAKRAPQESHEQRQTECQRIARNALRGVPAAIARGDECSDFQDKADSKVQWILAHGCG